MDTLTALKEQVVASLTEKTREYRQQSFTKKYWVALEDIHPAIYETLEEVLDRNSRGYVTILTACSSEYPFLKEDTPEEECDFTQGGWLHIVYHNLYEILLKYMEATYKAWYEEYHEHTQPTLTKLKAKVNYKLLEKFEENQEELLTLSLPEAYVEITGDMEDILDIFLDWTRPSYLPMIESCCEEEPSLIFDTPQTECKIEERDFHHRAYHNLRNLLREDMEQTFEDRYHGKQ